MGNIGAGELIFIAIFGLLVFGPKRLPEMGRSLGRGMREFKDSVSGKVFDDDEDETPRRQLPPAEEALGPQSTSASVPPRERDSVS